MSRLNEERGFRKTLSYLWHQVILPNVLWTIIIGVPSFAIYAYGMYKTINSFLQNSSIPQQYLVWTIVSLIFNGVALVALIIGVVYFANYIRRKKNTPVFPKLTFDYRVTSTEYALFFKNRKEIIQTQKVNMEALNDNLEEVTHNMTWTGQKYCKSILDMQYDGVELIDTDRSCPPYTVKIRFKHPLRRGDKATYQFMTYVEDDSKAMMPYISKVIKCQTEKLVIRVTAPRGMLISPHFRITTDSYQDIHLDEPIPIEAKSVGPDYEMFEWTVENLELLKCYSICWKFS